MTTLCVNCNEPVSNRMIEPFDMHLDLGRCVANLQAQRDALRARLVAQGSMELVTVEPEPEPEETEA